VDPRRLRDLLARVAAGDVTPDAALDRLRDLPFEDLGFARVDHHRALRQGAPEVVFGAGKTPAQVAAIVRAMDAGGSDVLVTRADAAQAAAVKRAVRGTKFDPQARTIIKRRRPAKPDPARPAVLIVSAGTSDLPVAAEAAATATFLGERVESLSDVGVAGIHRLLGHRPEIDVAGVVIVVAGMEGALASVVGGLARCPVIAVPTSVGYGASFHGLAALLAMLNSCAAGVTVVNIDNGFGAACAASRILRTGR
jgi:NCAIR mutase (PurE)-related protein